MKIHFTKKFLAIYTIAFLVIATGLGISVFSASNTNDQFQTEAGTGTGRYGRTCTAYSDSNNHTGCRPGDSKTLYESNGNIMPNHFVKEGTVYLINEYGNTNLGSLWNAGGIWCEQGYKANSCELPCNGDRDGTWSAWSSCTNGTQTRTNSCGAKESQTCQICKPGTKVSCNATAEGYKTEKTCNAQGSAYSSCVAIESCGDGIKNGNESCDDGNDNNTDSCSNTCQINEEPPTPEIDTPTFLGYNLQSKGSTAGKTPADIACETNPANVTWIKDGNPAIDSDSVSTVWTAVTGTSITYERKNSRPIGDTIIVQSGTTQTNSGFGDFGAGEGVYGIQVRAYSDTNKNSTFDAATEIASDYTEYCYIGYDITAPQFTAVKMFVNGTESTQATIGGSVTFRVTLSDTLSGVQSLEGWIAKQGGSPRIFTSHAVFTYNNTTSAWEYTFIMPATYVDGTPIELTTNGNYINFRGYDKAGNNSGIGNKLNFTVVASDTTAPAEPANLRFEESLSGDTVQCNEFTNEKTWYPTWDAVTDSDLAHYEYISFNTDGNIGTRRELTTPQFVHTWESGEGTYGFKVRAVDTTGNASEWVLAPNVEEYSSSCQIKVDLTAPVITIDSEETGFESLELLTVVGTVTDTFSGVNDVTIVLTSVTDENVTFEFTPTLDPATGTFDFDIDTKANAIPVGEYTLIVNASDIAGNESQSSELTFTVVEDLPPVVEITNPLEDAVITSTELSVDVTATDDAGMGSYYIRLWKDAAYVSNGGTLVGNCQQAPGGDLLGTNRSDTCSFDLESLTDGTYFITAQYLDNNTQWGTDEVEIEINKTAPKAPTMARIIDPTTGETLLTCGNEKTPTFGNRGLTTSADIRIVWNSNTESDLAGYYFGDKFTERYQSFSKDDTFQDEHINSDNNARYYSLTAFDTAGNESETVYCGEIVLIDYIPSPAFLGWNPEGIAPVDTIPGVLSCGSTFNGTTGARISSIWSPNTNEFVPIRFIRHTVRPNGANDLLLWESGNVQITPAQSAMLANKSELENLLATVTTGSYDVNYTNYGSFGANQGNYTMRVLAFADMNNDGRFQEGEPFSDWSNSCTITNSAPPAVVVPPTSIQNTIVAPKRVRNIYSLWSNVVGR